MVNLHGKHETILALILFRRRCGKQSLMRRLSEVQAQEVEKISDHAYELSPFTFDPSVQIVKNQSVQSIGGTEKYLVTNQVFTWGMESQSKGGGIYCGDSTELGFVYGSSV